MHSALIHCVSSLTPCKDFDAQEGHTLLLPFLTFSINCKIQSELLTWCESQPPSWMCALVPFSPHGIRAGLCEQWNAVTAEAGSHSASHFALFHHSLERKQASKWWGHPSSSMERHTGTTETPNLLAMWMSHLESGSSHPVTPAEDCTSGWHLEQLQETPWARGTQLSHSWILDPYKLWDLLKDMFF